VAGELDDSEVVGGSNPPFTIGGVNMAEPLSGTSVLRLVAICERDRFHLDRIENGVAYVLCKDGRMRRFPMDMFDKEGVS
jgi:hypothetical protein